MNLPKECWVIGRRIYTICRVCGKVICVNKRLFGSLHICDSEVDVS